MKVVISGKGGVGKTTISAFLARVLSSKRDVFLIDSDPSMNLNLLLGIKRPKPISELKELIRERTVFQNGIYIMNPYVDDIIEEYSVSINNIRLMVLGTIDKAYAGCICPETAFLRALLRRLMFKNHFLILDTEAGLEFIGRGLAENFDAMLIITEPSLKSIETSRRIYELSKELNIKKIYYVANKIKEEYELEFIEKNIGTKMFHVLHYDEKLKEIDIKGKTVFEINSRFYDEIKVLAEKLIKLIA